MRDESIIAESILDDESIEAFTALGLTLVQSKIFLALSQLKCASISQISELSKVPRQDIYRTVAQLEELSLVKKILTKPVRFEPLAMDEVWELLLKRKREEFSKLKQVRKIFCRIIS
jgi:sugar-specific transcriptional regulator TrmB